MCRSHPTPSWASSSFSSSAFSFSSSTTIFSASFPLPSYPSSTSHLNSSKVTLGMEPATGPSSGSIPGWLPLFSLSFSSSLLSRGRSWSFQTHRHFTASHCDESDYMIVSRELERVDCTKNIHPISSVAKMSSIKAVAQPTSSGQPN